MNLIEFKQTRIDATLAVVGSVLIHFLFFLIVVVWVSFASFLIVKELTETPKEKEEKVVLIRPEYFERVEPLPEPEKSQFTMTNPAAPEAVIEEANFIGERSTAAASETVLDEGAEELPTQITAEPEKEDQLPNTFNSDFVDAEPLETPAVATPEAVETQPQPEEQSEEILDTMEAPPLEENVVEEMSPPEPLPEKEELLETPTQIETLAETEVEEIIEEIKEPEEDTQEELAEINEPEQPAEEKGLPKPPTEATPSADSFQTEQKKTRLIGSLSRSGKSSLEVKGTALGKYYAEISKIIERKWQANCLQYREHIQPGVISMQFSVEQDGRISSPRPHDVVSTSQIQVGFTMKAIRTSKLPPMPPEVQKELEGERLELIYNFYF